jgi:hypothetical protein
MVKEYWTQPTTYDSAVGPTSYNTGQDILNALDSGFWCINMAPITEMHIFGHMYQEGIIGYSGNFSGLYDSTMLKIRSYAAVTGCKLTHYPKRSMRRANRSTSW